MENTELREMVFNALKTMDDEEVYKIFDRVLKQKVFKALKTMDDEEVCKIFNRFFRRSGAFHSINTMSRFDDGFSGYSTIEVVGMLADDFNANDAFYEYDVWNKKIFSFSDLKESKFFKTNIGDVVDEVVENRDALGDSTLDQILGGSL